MPLTDWLSGVNRTTAFAIMNPQGRKHAVLQVAALVGLVLHIALAGLFSLLQTKTLMWVNIGSICLWLLAWFWLRHHRDSRAAYLMFAELVGHSIVVTVLLGPSAGFQFYLWPAACLVVANPGVSVRYAGFAGVLCIVLFATLELWGGAVPFTRAFGEYQHWVYVANVLFGGIAMMLGIMSVRVVNEHQQRQLIALATHDPLTGLLNRRYMTEHMAQLKAHADREQGGFCVALADVDYFKRVNDTYGHDVGDQVLQCIALVLKARLRSIDLLARWGGEELLLALSNTDAQRALMLMDTLRQRVADSSAIKPLCGGVTLSFGVAEYQPGESIHDLIRRADVGLYRAKAQGRNQVVLEAIQKPATG
ncbi:GGDEF domain-containing protein [Gilvimarinus agarilyticus]|uniref:GGDEF domain-containing protein n=1 Tax=Gilvimarinus agarilyticus TaxID=679259 RepID=UPI0018DD61CB|nr:GGDEF domain-containing protein [Gilvimarinus agarilyticus]